MPYTTKGVRKFKPTGNPIIDALQAMQLAPSPMGMAAEEDDLLNIASDLLNAITKGDKGTASKLAQTLEEAGQAGGNKVLQKPMASAKQVLAPDPKIPLKQFGGKAAPMASPPVEAYAEDPEALIGELVKKVQGEPPTPSMAPRPLAPSGGPGMSMEPAPRMGPSAQKLAKGLRNEPRPKVSQKANTVGATTGVHANAPAWKDPEKWMSAEEKAYRQDFPKLEQPTGKLTPSPAEIKAIAEGKMTYEDWLADSYKNYKLGLEQHKVDMMRQNYELMRRLGMITKKKYGE